MDYIEWKQKQADWLDREYKKFLDSGLSQEEYWEKEDKIKLAIELKERDKRREFKKIKTETPKMSCLHFYGVKYESFEKEQEYFNTYVE